MFHVRFLALTLQVLARNIISVVLQFQTLMAITIVKIKTLSLLFPGLQKYLVAVRFRKCEKVEEKIFNFLFLFLSSPLPNSFCLFSISSSLSKVKCPRGETIHSFFRPVSFYASSKHQIYKATVTVVYFFVVRTVC